MSEKTTVNPISLELFRSALTAIAEEMGVVLTRSSYSPNIKERRDFSCALFDLDGRLVAQAAHIPVHLGSMPDSVASALNTDRKSTRLNSSHSQISYAVFCLKKKKYCHLPLRNPFLQHMDLRSLRTQRITCRLIHPSDRPGSLLPHYQVQSTILAVRALVRST